MQALGESLATLAVQVAALRGQVTLLSQRLDQAGLRGDLDLAARFEELAQTVAGALDAVAPRGRIAAITQTCVPDCAMRRRSW